MTARISSRSGCERVADWPVGAERNQAVLVSCQSAQALTMAQLREIVERGDAVITEPNVS